MLLYKEFINPRPEMPADKSRYAALWKVVGKGAHVLMALCLAVPVVLIAPMIIVEGEGSLSGRIAIALFLACFFGATSVWVLSYDYDLEHSTLELKEQRIEVCIYKLFIRFRKNIPLCSIAGFKKIPRRIQVGFSYRLDYAYIEAVSARGRRLFRIIDCPENRAWMEKWTGIPCEID